MTLEIAFLFLLLGGMVYLFLTEKIPVDLTAFSGLVILLFGGYLTAGEAFSGFSSSAVITMLAIFIVSAALLETGIADAMGRRVHQAVGDREVPLIIAVMLVAGVLSAFMNNIAATAVLMPAVASIARRSGLAPSRLFMPLSFGAILGGTTTLVGTPPNILAGELLAERDLEPFGLFDFTPLGVAILGVGILYMTTIGRKLLPNREIRSATPAGGDLTRLYQIEEQLFSIRIPDESPLAGRTLAETRLGTALAAQVVAIEREGKERLAPGPDTVLARGDSLVVAGSLEEVQELLRIQGVEVERIEEGDLPRPLRGVGGVRVRLLPGSPLAGQNLRQLAFRERFGLVVVGIDREEVELRQHLALEPLQEGDEIIALGTRAQIEELATHPDLSVEQVGFEAVDQLQQELYAIAIPEGSPLVGQTVGGSRIGELAGVTVGGIIRDGETRLAVSPDEVLRSGDRLIVAGHPARILSLLELGLLELGEHAGNARPSRFRRRSRDEERRRGPQLESENVGIAEAVVAPRSAAAGRTLAELEFRQRHGLQVLALWHQGEPIHRDLALLPLSFGDALLLQGPRERIRRLATEPDFVVLSQAAQAPARTKKAPFALGALALMVTLVVTGLQPIHVAAFTAAVAVLLARAVTMEEAYRAIEWRAIFLVAAVLPVGVAMERTGAAALLSNTVVASAGPLGPYAVLAALVGLSSLLSQGLDGAPAVVLLAPVAIQAAAQLDLSPYPVMMGVSLAASAAFMTPFSHKANLLVMGAGGYRSMDYVKVGTPLTIVLLALIVFLVPIFFPW